MLTCTRTHGREHGWVAQGAACEQECCATRLGAEEVSVCANPAGHEHSVKPRLVCTPVQASLYLCVVRQACRGLYTPGYGFWDGVPSIEYDIPTQ
jgi:hypothetical protein